MSFMGWYDPDPKKPARQKLAAAVIRYQDKFGQQPTLCLTSPQDAAALAEPSPRFPNAPSVVVEARNYIHRHTFYVGQTEDATPAGRGAL